ncbi:MAG: TIGR01841 family phasin [Alsobacter sp.]
MPSKPRSIPSATKVAPTTEAKPASAKPATAKPAAPKAVAARPAPAKAVAAKPKPVAKVAAAKPAVAKAAPTRPAQAKAAPAKPAVTAEAPRPAAAKPVHAKAEIASKVEVPKVEAPKPAPVPAPAPAPVAPAAVQVLKPAVAPVEAKRPTPAPKAAPELTVTTVSASIGLPFVPTGALPKAMQDFAHSGLDQAREAYQKARTSAETLTHGVGSSGEAAAKGVQDFSRTLIDAIQANTDATLGFLKAMSGVRSLSEAVELQARHARTQFESVTEQAKTLAGIANRTVTETTQPVRQAFDQALKAGR